MVKKNKKHKSPLNTPLPSWQTALSLVKGDAQDKASYYREKAKVKNTEKSTKNWIMKFEEFRSQSGYLISLTELDNIYLLEKQLVEYISIMKKKDGNEYKATSVKQAIDAINRYLLHHMKISVKKIMIIN
jgi:hypothetical protein